MLTYDRSGSGVPLLLLHGIGSRRQIWDPVVDALAAEHDVVAVDLPGFGASPPLDGPVNLATLTDAVAAFAAELGLARWHVAGNSMGAGIALELAARGTVASATAVSPVGFWTARERRYGQSTLGATRALGRRLRDAGAIPALVGTAAGRTLVFGQTFGRPWRLGVEESIATIDAFVDCPSWDEALAAFDGYVAPFDHGDVPVTVAWGTHDWLLLPRQGRRARRAMPRARHVWLPGCGHAPFADDPERVAAVLLAGTR
jgi:pimeloyl-ACP methyl ester carboxylesterase